MSKRKPKHCTLSVTYHQPPKEIDAKLVLIEDGANIPAGYTFWGNVALLEYGTYMLLTKLTPQGGGA